MTVSQSAVCFNIRVILLFPLMPDTNRLFLFNLVLFLEPYNHPNHPSNVLNFTICFCLHNTVCILLNWFTLDSYYSSDLARTTEYKSGLWNFLHVTDSIQYRSTDLFITQHHFRLSFCLQVSRLWTLPVQKLSENVNERPDPLQTQQPSPQTQNHHHTLNLFLGFYGSVRSFPSNPENPQDTYHTNGVNYLNLKHMRLCPSASLSTF